jgi:hypothetical protein
MLKVVMSDIIELEVPVNGAIHSNSNFAKAYKVSYANADIQYNDFFRRYLYGNRPCIVRGQITESWKSAIEWISDCRPNFSYICQRFGTYFENIVMVVGCTSFVHFGSDNTHTFNFTISVLYNIT